MSLILPELDRLPPFPSAAARIRRELPTWQQAVEEECRRHGAIVIDLAAVSTEIDAHPESQSSAGLPSRAHGYRRLAAIIFATLSSD